MGVVGGNGPGIGMGGPGVGAQDMGGMPHGGPNQPHATEYTLQGARCIIPVVTFG